MRRALWCAVFVVALVAAGCGASGEEGEPAETTTSAAPAEGDDARFGDMDEPVCGDGDLSVEPSQAAGSADVLRIGVLNDRSSDIRPGLNKNMWDASVAFVDWCNEQGGIGGLPIELVDLDAALFNVEAAMTTACTDVFALVGGGLAQDQLVFSGNAASDFHQCELIDIPGFANSPEKADSNGQVQPVPNPGGSAPNTWFRDFAELFPDDAVSWSVIWGDLPSLESVKNKYEAAVADVGGYEILQDQSYPPTGAQDWRPYAQNLVDSGATSFTWVGEAEFLATFLSTARQIGWQGRALLETNMYDQVVSGTETSEGTVVRTAFHPLEEADDWPGVADYLELVESRVEDPVIGGLGMQAMSAWLLFATAANACGEANEGVLERTCILEQAAAVQDWTGGGLHAPQDPDRFDEVAASPCGMLLIVEDGEFVRLYPEVGGEGDDVAGFHCPDDGVSSVPGGSDAGIVDPDRPI